MPQSSTTETTTSISSISIKTHDDGEGAKSVSDNRGKRKRKLLSSTVSNNKADLVGKFEKLLCSIRSGDKLSDEHITAASDLLRAQFAHVQGLCTPVLGQKLCFPLFDEVIGYAGHSYIQVLHTGTDHWIAVKIISDNELHVYDSLFTQKPTYFVLKQVAAIVRSRSNKVTMHLERVQFQRNSQDCGVYAIAFITDLCYGRDPAAYQYAGSKELRKHLLNCFQSGNMTAFPTIATISKVPSQTFLMNVYCSCRLPIESEHTKIKRNSATDMVQCGICDRWYHYNCVNLTITEAKRIKACREMWMCNNGCHGAFGDIFDSD